ncbi:MAG: cyclic pyranopterin monophosphate synthase MoaC [Tsuneonella sp.]
MTLTHLDESGAARMVDVGGKAETSRSATARGSIRMSKSALAAVREGSGPKGDVLAVARVAGIMAAKKTADLIPLCHPLALDSVIVEFTFLEDGLEVSATVSLTGRTGVEMEAMTATSVALLTVYDMAKALDKGMVVGDIRLISKTGGKSGDWHRSG